MSLWGSGLFLAGYGTYQVWTFVLDKQTVFRTKKQPTLSDREPNELKVSFVEQWPASMQAVFYFVVLGAYFSCLAFMGSVGLYASHWAFNKTQPDWLSELVLQTLRQRQAAKRRRRTGRGAEAACGGGGTTAAQRRPRAEQPGAGLLPERSPAVPSPHAAPA